ncbi:MAG: diadenylate cyclase [Bacteriovoracaceae bacterium]|nr:diadenylate cyclase [Bacteriovoracaceae bacterium]
MNYFLYTIKSFSTSDAVDIAIIAFVIYRFFLIVQGTRAAGTLVGLSFVMTLYWGSIRYELHSVNWALSNFFDYFFLFIIVIFQDQIRTTLLEIGNSRFFRKKKKVIYEEEIEEIVTACEALRRQSLGALVVIERNSGLLNFSKTGTKINSEIHADVIYSLFQPSSPLHDGALILFNHKIQSAGCFLPLSTSSKLKKNVGTRHRAALGITEVSDAVAVCLSEENANISIAYKGKFIEVDNFTDLSIKLYQLLYSIKDGHNNLLLGQGA